MTKLSLQVSIAELIATFGHLWLGPLIPQLTVTPLLATAIEQQTLGVTTTLLLFQKFIKSIGRRPLLDRIRRAME